MRVTPYILTGLLAGAAALLPACREAAEPPPGAEIQLSRPFKTLFRTDILGSGECSLACVVETPPEGSNFELAVVRIENNRTRTTTQLAAYRGFVQGIWMDSSTLSDGTLELSAWILVSQWCGAHYGNGTCHSAWRIDCRLASDSEVLSIEETRLHDESEFVPTQLEPKSTRPDRTG